MFYNVNKEEAGGFMTGVQGKERVEQQDKDSETMSAVNCNK